MKIGFEYRLSAMLGRLQRSIRQGGQTQDLIVPLVDLCCSDYLYTSAPFCSIQTHRRANLDLEHCHPESVPRGVFVGLHNVKIYAIRPFQKPCHYVSTVLAS